MASTANGKMLQRGGILALVVLAALLGFRAFRTAGAVLSPSASPGDMQAAATGVVSSPLEVLWANDSIRAFSEPCQRDPFSRPQRRPSRPARVKKPDPDADSNAVPILSALLYDNVQPAVQLRLGSAVSSWLKEGEDFQGWTVLLIGPDSVTVRKDGATTVLE